MKRGRETESRERACLRLHICRLPVSMGMPVPGGGDGGGCGGVVGVSRFTLAQSHEVLPGEGKSGSVPGTSSTATVAGPAVTEQPSTSSQP